MTQSVIGRKAPGRRSRYGEKLVRIDVWVVPAVARHLREDTVVRNALERTRDWSDSRVAHERLAAAYGIELVPPQDAQGGRDD